jgi:hypothetical protein
MFHSLPSPVSTLYELSAPKVAGVRTLGIHHCKSKKGGAEQNKSPRLMLGLGGGCRSNVAEREGFEPSRALDPTRFRDERTRPDYATSPRVYLLVTTLCHNRQKIANYPAPYTLSTALHSIHVPAAWGNWVKQEEILARGHQAGDFVIDFYV